jgi:predicted ferric reductase
VFLAGAYLFLVVAPLALFVLLRGESDRMPPADIGVDCAVVGFTILALQFPLAARFRWLEAPFGLDLLVAFHKKMALVAMTLLCVHPLAIASVQGWYLLTRVKVPWYIWTGRITLLLLLAHAAISVGRRILRLPYHHWKRLHNVVAPTILLLGFAHSAAAGDDISGTALATWTALLLLALSCCVHIQFVRPRLLRNKPFRVADVKLERPGVWSLTLESCTPGPFNFLPGQFQFLRVFDSEVSSEEHPFSIASSPADPNQLTITVKECGDFTSSIGLIAPGTLATVHGPFGRFCPTLQTTPGKSVFVAAGVGITPFMSTLRHMRDTGRWRPVRLIYASRRREDVIFLNELTEMEAAPGSSLTVAHVLSSGPTLNGAESGRLDSARLVRLCDGVDDKSFYLCCPLAMTTTLARGLRRAGVSSRHIHADYFSL